MVGALQLGVDGIITDRPDLLRNVLEEQKVALPPAVAVEP